MQLNIYQAVDFPNYTLEKLINLIWRINISGNLSQVGQGQKVGSMTHYICHIFVLYLYY